MKYWFAICFWLISLTASATTVATVDGHPITDLMIYAANPQARENPTAFKDTLNVLVSRQLLADVARSENILNQSALDADLAVQKQMLEAKAAAQAYLHEHPVSERKIQQVYQDYLKSLPTEEFRFRYILVKSYEEGELVIDGLKRGKSFTQLAAEYSIAKNAATGGEVGWVPENETPATLIKYLQSAEPMAVYGPIPSPGGFIVFQFLGKRAFPKPRLEEVEGQIRTKIENEEVEQYIDRLRKKSSIVIEKVDHHD